MTCHAPHRPRPDDASTAAGPMGLDLATSGDNARTVSAEGPASHGAQAAPTPRDVPDVLCKVVR